MGGRVNLTRFVFELLYLKTKLFNICLKICKDDLVPLLHQVWEQNVEFKNIESRRTQRNFNPKPTHM